MDNDEEKKRQDPPVSFIDQDVNIDELWSRFQNMFSSLGRLKLAGDFSGPEIFFGLGHDSVMKHLRQLSNDISISI